MGSTARAIFVWLIGEIKTSKQPCKHVDGEQRAPLKNLMNRQWERPRIHRNSVIADYICEWTLARWQRFRDGCSNWGSCCRSLVLDACFPAVTVMPFLFCTDDDDGLLRLWMNATQADRISSRDDDVIHVTCEDSFWSSDRSWEICRASRSAHTTPVCPFPTLSSNDNNWGNVIRSFSVRRSYPMLNWVTLVATLDIPHKFKRRELGKVNFMNEINCHTVSSRLWTIFGDNVLYDS